MSKKKKKGKKLINGLNPRHVDQIIRRKMTQKVKPSGKIYSRKNNKKQNDQS